MIEIERVYHPGIRVAFAGYLIELSGVALDGALKHADSQYAQ